MGNIEDLMPQLAIQQQYVDDELDNARYACTFNRFFCSAIGVINAEEMARLRYLATLPDSRTRNVTCVRALELGADDLHEGLDLDGDHGESHPSGSL